MLDLVIKNARIADGTGQPAFLADLAVQNGVITKIGAVCEEAAETIDAAQRLVTPGFIDLHSHGDATMAFFPEMQSKVMQGITTIVGGQCGISPAPCDVHWLSQYFEMEQLSKLSDHMYDTPELADPAVLSPLMKEKYGTGIEWRTFGEYLSFLERQGFGANYVALVGHGTIRAQVMGEDYRRKATPDEIARMCDYLRDAMRAGARGMSVGLDYPPGIFADFTELLALAKTLAEFDGLYAAHWRKTGLREGTPKRQKKLDGIKETLEIGLQAGVAVQLSHLSCGFDVYPSTDDAMMCRAAERTLEVIDEYRARGVRARFDVIPNITGGILLAPDLMMFFMPWAIPCGSREQFAKNLRPPDYRTQIHTLINSGTYYTLNPVVNPEWAEYITVLACSDETAVGQTLAALAEARGRGAVDLALDLLAADPYTKVFQIVQNMNEEAVRTFIAHPDATIGSDTFAVDLCSTIPLAENMPGYYMNPNTYCGFVRYLTHFPQSSIEETIRKATGSAAQAAGLTDRGVIAEGMRADLLILDESKLDDRENRIDPRVWPTGVDYVFVNGIAAVRDGACTLSRSGQVLRWSK